MARRAGVSCQWLYKQPQLGAEIERRRKTPPSREDAGSARERSTEVSLRQRLKTLLAENARLRDKNAMLTEELALAYGRQRELSLLPKPRAASDPRSPKDRVRRSEEPLTV